jgi:hypothetical protein
MSAPLRVVRITHVDAAGLLEHARRQQRRAVDGGPTWQFWTRLIAVLVDAGAAAGIGS